MPRLPLLTIAAAGLVLLAACSDDDTSTGDTSSDTRTVEIDMVDIGFEPDTLEVSPGETVRFVFTNTGDVAHDAFIGDHAAQAGHEADMRAADDDMHGDHGEEDADAVTVEPGNTAELTHTFDDAGTIEIGCHQEGHYDAGMKIAVEVA